MDETAKQIRLLRHTIAAIAIWQAQHSDCSQEAEEQLELVLFRLDKNVDFIKAITCIKPLTQTAAGASNSSRTDPGMVVS